MVRSRKCASKCHKNEWQHKDLTAVVRLQANVKANFFSKSLRGFVCKRCTAVANSERYKARSEKIDLRDQVADIRDDIRSIPRIKTLEEPLSYRPGKWLSERPQSVQSYARALCGLKNENGSNNGTKMNEKKNPSQTKKLNSKAINWDSRPNFNS